MVTDIYTTDKKYKIIYADPPWKYKTWRDGMGTAEKHYPTMNIEDIVNMKKGSLNDPLKIAKDISNTGHWGNGDYCVTINRCWFKNEEGKKPREFLTLDPSSSTLSILLGNSGLYHKYCHCKKEAIDNPTVDKIKLIIPDGTIDWMIKDKGHTLKEMGYKEDEFEMVVAIIGNLVKKEFVKGNYFAKLHDKYGYKIGFIINDFPGKNEDQGKFYKIKSGWTIFPNGKLKCNTLVGGLLK